VALLGAKTEIPIRVTSGCQVKLRDLRYKENKRATCRLVISPEPVRGRRIVEATKTTQSDLTRQIGVRRIEWPKGSNFAFTVFDDPDGQSFETTRLVYSFLADLGFRTTIGVWPLDIRREPNSGGETCANPEYRAFLQDLQAIGFEIGFHNAAPYSTTRDETVEGLSLFQAYFGKPPAVMANHYNADAIYWGPARLTGWRQALYNLITLGRTRGKWFGHVETHPSFWGDICSEKIRYCRNFIYSDIDTLHMNPWMPYFDPLRPYVRGWYSASEGHNACAFLKTLRERNQDRLEAEGGACIMYTHFGHGYVQNGKLTSEFCRTMEHLARKNGWFVPVSELLDFLADTKGLTVLDDRLRRRLETRWLWEKLFRGTS
jgi:hypothetical protein